jgi:hypothetical protein
LHIIILLRGGAVSYEYKQLAKHYSTVLGRPEVFMKQMNVTVPELVWIIGSQGPPFIIQELGKLLKK